MKQNNKQIFRIIATASIAGVLLFVLFYAFPIAAQKVEYTLLQPLITPSSEPIKIVDNLGVYLNSIFRVVLGIIGILAVIKIILGGLQYLSTDAVSGKSEGKASIQAAVGGLLLAITAWIILYTINPKLLDILNL